MHPLLPFYGVMSLLALASMNQRTQVERLVLWLGAWGAMTVIALAVAFRPVVGDTWRYMYSFLRWRELSLHDLFSQAQGNPAFSLLNWVFGQMTADIRPLLVVITLFCVAMLWRSLRQTLSSTYAVVALLLYSTYPFWVFYVSSGIKQGIAMTLLMQGYADLQMRRPLGWAFLVAAPAFHSSAIIVIAPLLVHLLMWRKEFGYSRALFVSLCFLAACIFLSITNLNQSLLAGLQPHLGSATDAYSNYLDAI